MEKEKDQELKIKAEEAISDEVAETTADSKSDEAAGDVTQESVDLDEPDKPEQNAPKEIKSAAPAPQKIDLGENSPFEILELIGQGGMGAVYKAKNKQTGDLFAIKVLLQELADDTTSIKRFKQEAEAAGKLDHVNLANVFGHGTTDDGAPYLVMEYLEGRSLRDLLEEEGRLPPDQALDIFIQVTEGLSYAHKAGIIHRDIKPSNIYLTKNDTGVTIPKVLDFGIAQVRSSSGRETQDLTQTGAVFGSPQYMSPEQCLGFMLDERSDIYSLGCFIYEVLTGSPPFKGDNPIQLVVSHINEQPVGFKREIKAGATMKNLEKIALRCLNKEQGDRYQTIDELIQDLKLVAQNKSIPDYNTGKAKKFSITRRPVITVVATVCLLAGFLPSLLQDWFSLYEIRRIGTVFFVIVSIIFGTIFLSTGMEKLRERLKFKGSQKQWINAAIPLMLGTTGFLLVLNICRIDHLHPIFTDKEQAVAICYEQILFWSQLLAKFLVYISFVGLIANVYSKSDKKVSPVKPVFWVGVTGTILGALLTFALPKMTAKQIFETAKDAEIAYPKASIFLSELAFKLDKNSVHYGFHALNVLERQKLHKQGLAKVNSLLREPRTIQVGFHRELLLKRRAQFNKELGNKKEELSDINEIIDLNSESKTAYINKRAIYKANAGDFTDALADTNESLNLEPSYRNFAHSIRVNILIRMNELDKAIIKTNELSQFDAKKSSWIVLRALIHKKAGDTEAEYKDYELALSQVKKLFAKRERLKISIYREQLDYEAGAYAADKLGKLDDRDMLLKKYFFYNGNLKSTDLNQHLFLEKTGLEVDWQRTKPK